MRPGGFEPPTRGLEVRRCLGTLLSGIQYSSTGEPRRAPVRHPFVASGYDTHMTREPYASYLVTTEVAELMRCSVRTVHELTRRRAIPHRRVPGTRRCLFVESELREWLNGAELDIIELPASGRVVRIIPRR